MKKLVISDMTLKQAASSFALSFKEKMEIAKLLDKLNISVIELPASTGAKADEVLIKTICSCVKNSAVSLPCELEKGGASRAFALIKNASHPILQIAVPMSTVQMEYVCHKKPDAVLEMISETVADAKSICNDIEFIASDATRSESEFLAKAIENAVLAGASTVTLCDTAGEMTTDEFIKFVEKLYETVPVLKDIKVYISASDELGMANSTVLAAIKLGIDGIKTTCCNGNIPSLEAIMKIIRARGETIGAKVDVSLTEFQRVSRQIAWICEGRKTDVGADANVSLGDNSYTLNEFAELATVSDTVMSLGYDMSEEDMARVYEEFKRTAGKKTVSMRELDAIVANSAMQVPATYKLISYVINSGNVISSTANVLLEKDGKQCAGVCIGDGPIDAAFLAIEQILGHHYELDDFQIQSVTEGREAMGSAVVKLKADGKVYSGNGISTDIIGASIRAYISAINKIVYEQTV